MKGRALSKENNWDAALAEFLASRKLYPTWSATSNAGICLKNLKRYDEALTLFEALLAEFATTLPKDAKTAAQGEVVELRGRLGTIAIQGARTGATLSIDGRDRGEHPSVAPLRVDAGSHIVRVYKDGFQPFQARIEVAGGQTTQVNATLEPLLVAGRLHVEEKSGKPFDVVIDGFTVGQTPWEGSVAIGEHTVVLRSNESLGTLPTPVTIKATETTKLALTVEALDAEVVISPTPPDATVSVDSVFVGRGMWTGRLRPGAHPIKVIADGYFTRETKVDLARGAREVVSVALARDPNAPRWQKPGWLTFELGGAVPIAPSFGGEVAGACTSPCSHDLGKGGELLFHGGYERASGFGFGVSLGYLTMRQTTTARPTTVQAVGPLAANPGAASDTITVRGFRAGAFGAVRLGDAIRFRLRLGAGVLIGSVIDSRTGAFHVSDTTIKAAYPVGPLVQTLGVTWFYVEPQLGLGIRVGEHFEVGAGLSTLVLIRPSPPSWDEKYPVNAGSDGYGQFKAGALTNAILFALEPGLSLRYNL